jgi:DNA-binding LacI/PurR family transcriptional regulator
MCAIRVRRIAVLTPEAGGYYNGDVFRGVERACQSRNAQAIIIQTALSWASSSIAPLPSSKILSLARQICDGSIVVTAVMEPHDLEVLRTIEGPLVTIAGAPLREGGISVRADNAGGATLAVRHLIEHGHTRIGFLGAHFHFDVRERYDAYLETLGAAGITPDPSLSFALHDEFAGGARAAADGILDAGLPLTAVFAATDVHAVGLMDRLRERGVRVPEDVAIVGFDDWRIAQTAVPSLTTIRQAPESLGFAATHAVLDEIEGLPVSAGRTLLPTSLVVRHSCGCFETPESIVDHAVDWTSPEWRENLADALTRALDEPSLYASADRREVWPSVDILIDAFDRAVQGWPATHIGALDEAWGQASARTRSAETLLGLIDLLEYVGMCRQGVANSTDGAVRLRLSDFLAQCRMQVLRFAAIADPMNHPEATDVTRDVIRSFLEEERGKAPNLEWLRHLHAVSGCLALWEADPSGTSEKLRIVALYGADGRTPGGSLIQPGSFPPLGWLDAGSPKGEASSTVTIVPVATNSRELGVLAAILPNQRRFFDGYWELEYGAALLALSLERPRP